MPKAARSTSKAALAAKLNGSPARGKIQDLSSLVMILDKARKQGKRIALCHGVFDLLHPGHIVHFQEARKHGDIVVVTITPDHLVNKGPGRPVFSQQLRLATLAAIEFIDYTAINEWPTAVETIRLLRPHVYVKGSDYSNQEADITGKIGEEEAAIKEVGGQLVYTGGFTSSSSHLINRFFSAYPAATQEYLHRFRQKYSADQVVARLKSLHNLKVLVVGEAILDEYWYCLPLGKSPKETIVSTKFASDESFAGGAVATANHMAGFCSEVTLLTGLGANEQEEGFFRRKLRPNVRMEAVRTSDRPTVRKRRFLEPAFMTKMFELQFLDDSPIAIDDQETFARKFNAALSSHDLVVVNDFGHGLLTERLRKMLSGCGKYLALNTQSNSANHGYNAVTNYAHADYVAVDEPELRLAARSRYGELRDETAKIREALGAKICLISRGHKGSVILSEKGQWDETPALAMRIIDRTGAGDALFSITSPCAYSGMPQDMLGFVANCAGAMAVEIVCNREPIDPVGMCKFVETLLK